MTAHSRRAGWAPFGCAPTTSLVCSAASVRIQFGANVTKGRVFSGLVLGLALGGCTSWLPDLSNFGSGQVVELRLQSEPSGAEARAAGGVGCRTPCTLAIVPRSDFTVTFSLPGYLPQSVPVEITLRGDSRADPDGMVAQVDFIPNPVFAVLDPAPPPVAKKPARRRTPSPPRAAGPSRT